MRIVTTSREGLQNHMEYVRGERHVSPKLALRPWSKSGHVRRKALREDSRANSRRIYRELDSCNDWQAAVPEVESVTGALFG